MAARKHGIGKSVFSVSGLILVLAGLILVNLILTRVNLRWDLTEDRLYSLSEGSLQILSDLDREVTIKLFMTRDNVNVPVAIRNYTERLIDFLSEYEYESRGDVRLDVIDTRIDSEEEEWAQKYGIRGIDMPNGERIYLGLVAESADQEQTIPMLDPASENQLEYDITRLISLVQTARQQKIAVISGLPVFGGARTNFSPSGGQAPWLFVKELKKTYQVENINPNTPSPEIPEGTNLVILVHPRDLSQQMLYAVDQYLLGGGNLLVFVDPYSVMDMNPGIAKGSSLEPLFAAWGVKMDKNRVLADLNNATRLRAENNRIEENPLWLSLRPEAFNADALITGELESMLLPVAGALEKVPGSNAGLEYEPLLQSSQNSTLIDAFKTRFGVNEIRRDFKSDGKRRDLAVRLRGRFPSAFAGGPPEAKDAGEDMSKKAETAKAPPASHRSEAEKPATVIILADADCLYDGYYMSRQNFLGFELANIFNDNLNFLLNAGEMLSGEDALIRIRSRGTHERPFDRVKELEARAQQRWLAREQELVKKVDELNARLKALESTKDASQNLILSPEQEAEVRKFQDEKLRINKELKKVRRNLRSDIEALGFRVKFFNIFGVPLLVCLGGVVYAIYRRKKSRSS